MLPFRPRTRSIALVVLSVSGAVVLSASLAAASTTISTDIQTDGSLSVTGTSTLDNVVIDTNTPSNSNNFDQGLTMSDSGITGGFSIGYTPDVYFTQSEYYPGHGGIYVGAQSDQSALLTDQPGSDSVIQYNPSYSGTTGIQPNLGNALFLVTGSAVEGFAVPVGTPIFGVSNDYSPNLILSAVSAVANYIPGYGRVGVNQNQPQGEFQVTSWESGIPAVLVQGASGQTANLQQWENSASTTVADISPSGGAYFASNVGVATTSPVANFQVANGSNATTTMEIGSGGQNKGSCLKLYRTDGSPIYAYVAAGATTFTLSTTACASVSDF